jgi:hypothetical protein
MQTRAEVLETEGRKELRVLATRSRREGRVQATGDRQEGECWQLETGRILATEDGQWGGIEDWKRRRGISGKDSGN